jgi:membrane-associated phospholipid phosphatase
MGTGTGTVTGTGTGTGTQASYATPTELSYKPLDLKGANTDLNSWTTPPIWPRHFSDDAWAPTLMAIGVAAEFCQHVAAWSVFEPAEAPWVLLNADLGDANDDNVKRARAEIIALQDKRDAREERLPESLVQADAFAPYFASMIGMDSSRAPYTSAVFNVAVRVGEIVAMHHKAKFKRPRPSALAPGLVPPFGPPSHPAFPSGHSTQAHLLMHLLLAIPGIEQRFRKPLEWLATRVAENREFMGLHFPSDTAFGKTLAQRTSELLIADVPSFQQLLARARQEWP